MTNPEHYSFRVRWSREDGAFVGTVAEMPSLSWLADSQVEALLGIRELVAGVLGDMAVEGEEPPVPIADRAYSGKFLVRVPPEVHRQLALDAAEQHVSLNRLASARLTGS